MFIIFDRNCQVGVGRSTTGTVIATLLTRWIRPTNMGLSTYHQARYLPKLSNHQQFAKSHQART
jgi:hypothetical protein